MPKQARTHSKRTNGRAASNGHGQSEPAERLDNLAGRRNTYTSRRGVVIDISGVSPFLIEKIPDGLRAEWAEQGREMPDPPTYEIELPGGDKETREHDETTLETDAEREAWAAYQARAEEFAHEVSQRRLRLALIRGVTSQPPADGQWIADQRMLGIRAPSDPLELKYHWVLTEIVSEPIEAVELMSEIFALSGVSREALQVATESFRDTLEKSAWPDARGAAA